MFANQTNHMRNLLLPFVVLIASSFYGQESAPTLSIGIDKVLFSKGALDVELISQMIASKQDELKNTIVKKEILKRINQEGSFATRNYAFNVVDVILNERNKGVLKREILEHTANFAFVYGVSELYLRLASESKRDQLVKVLADMNYPALDSIYDESGNRPLGLFLERLNVPMTVDGAELTMANVMLDIVFDISQHDEQLKGKGFFRKPLYQTWDEYEVSNGYYLLLNSAEMSQEKVLNMKALKSDIKEFLRQVTRFYNIIGKVDGADDLESLRAGLEARIKENTEHLKANLLADAIKITNELYEKHRKSIKEGENLEQVIEMLRQDLSDKAQKAVGYDLESIKSMREDSAELVRIGAEFEQLCADIKACAPGYRDGQNVKKFLKNEIARKSAGGGALTNKGYLDSLETLLERNASLMSQFDRITGLNPYSEDNFRKVWEQGLELKVKGLDDFNEYVVAKKLLDNTYENSDRVNRALELLDEEMQERKKQIVRKSNAIAKNLDENVRYLNEQLEEIAKQGLEIAPKDDSVLLELYRQLYVLKNPKHEFINYHYVDYLRDDLLPGLRLVDQHQQGRFNLAIRLIENIAYLIEEEIFKPFTQSDQIEGGSLLFVLLQKGDKINFDYINFLEKLDHLEEADTYSYLLHTLLGIGDIHEKKGTSRALNTVVNAVEKYIEFGVEEEYIDLDVEGIILALYEQYADRDFNAFNFHLTVGLNQASFLQRDFELSEGNSLSSMGFASEKIGLKLKLINWKLRRSYLPGEVFRKNEVSSSKVSRHYSRDPVITDLHLLIYGSGLLYNLTSLTSTPEFNYPLTGVSIGLSSYNHLDFNFGVAVPIAGDRPITTSDLMLNIGFDIRFSEYLTELNKKRKQRKNDKENSDGLTTETQQR